MTEEESEDTGGGVRGHRRSQRTQEEESEDTGGGLYILSCITSIKNALGRDLQMVNMNRRDDNSKKTLL